METSDDRIADAWMSHDRHRGESGRAVGRSWATFDECRHPSSPVVADRWGARVHRYVDLGYASTRGIPDYVCVIGRLGRCL